MTTDESREITSNLYNALKALVSISKPGREEWLNDVAYQNAVTIWTQARAALSRAEAILARGGE